MTKSKNVNENDNKKSNVKVANFGGGFHATNRERTLDDQDFETTHIEDPDGENVLVLTRNQV